MALAALFTCGIPLPLLWAHQCNVPGSLPDTAVDVLRESLLILFFSCAMARPT